MQNLAMTQQPKLQWLKFVRLITKLPEYPQDLTTALGIRIARICIIPGIVLLWTLFLVHAMYCLNNLAIGLSNY
jgi:hypothetical protein